MTYGESFSVGARVCEQRRVFLEMEGCACGRGQKSRRNLCWKLCDFEQRNYSRRYCQRVPALASLKGYRQRAVRCHSSLHGDVSHAFVAGGDEGALAAGVVGGSGWFWVRN